MQQNCDERDGFADKASPGMLTVGLSSLNNLAESSMDYICKTGIYGLETDGHFPLCFVGRYCYRMFTPDPAGLCGP